MRTLTHGRGSNHGVGGKLAFFFIRRRKSLGGCCGFNLREREEKLRALGETLSTGVEAKAASGQVLTSSAIPIVQSQPYYGTTENNSLFFFEEISRGKYHEWKTEHEYYIIRTTYFLNFSEN